MDKNLDKIPKLENSKVVNSKYKKKKDFAKTKPFHAKQKPLAASKLPKFKHTEKPALTPKTKEQSFSMQKSSISLKLVKKPTKKLIVKAPTKSSRILEKNKSLFLEVLRLHMYYGDSHLRNHYSQNSFVQAYRNEYSMYNIHGALYNLKRALHFLQKQNKKNFVFVGSPKWDKEKMSLFFQKIEVPFFPSSEWVPGFISKKAYNSGKILIIYDVFTNHGAKSEAFHAAYPIVGFFTILGDVRGIDFPINLNIEHVGGWYYSLWKSFFQIKTHDTRSQHN